MLQKLTRIFDSALPPVVIAAGFFTLHYILFVVPAEQIMGAVQKVLYVHVGSAFATYLSLAFVCIGSVGYLALEDRRFLHVLKGSATVGFAFASIVLITGMIWGHSSWNTWWRWEPRLTAMLLLWVFVLALCYASRQSFKTRKEEGVVLSCLGVLATLQVPVVMFSIKLLNRTEQLHPEVIDRQGLTDSGYKIALLLASLTILGLAGWLIRLLSLVEGASEEALDIERKMLMKNGV